VRVAIIRAHFLISVLEQVCILGLDDSFIN
jgi:hypothetical protein